MQRSSASQLTYTLRCKLLDGLLGRSFLGRRKVQNAECEPGRVQGQALGCGAHLTVLRRESIGEHSVAGAWVLADLVEAAQKARYA